MSELARNGEWDSSESATNFRSDGMVLQFADGAIASCNPVALQILGYKAEQLIGKALFDFPRQIVHRDGSAFLPEENPALVTLRTGQPCSNVTVGFYRPDGKLVWLKLDSQPLFRAAESAPYAVVTTIADVTAECNRCPSEERYRALIELSPQIVFISQPDGSIIYCNQWGLQFTGRSLEELQGDGWLDSVRPDDRDRVYRAWQTATKQVSDYEIEIPFRRADGVYRWIYTRARPVRDNNGKIDYWIGVGLDISDRTQIEQELQQTNQTLRTLIESSPLPIVAIEPNANVRIWNKAATELFGWSEAEVLNQPIPIVRPDQLEECQQLRDAVANGQMFGIETYRRKQDGSELIVSISAAPVYGNSGSVDEIMLIFQDITARKQSEAALHDSEQRYRMLFDSMDQGFCVCEMLFDDNGAPNDYRFLEVNRVFEQMTGLEGTTGKTALQLVPNLETFWIETYGRVALTGEPAWLENKSEAMNRWFDVRAFRVGEAESHKFAVLFTDISDRKRTEQSWRESEERLRLGMQVAGFALAKFDYASNTVELSPEIAALYGLPTDELVVPRSRIHDTFHPEEREEMAKLVEQVLDPSGPGWFNRDHRVVWENGEVRWLTVRKQVFFDRSGETPRPTHAILAAIDISDRKQAELALTESESRFRTLADNIAQLAWMTDSNGWIFWYNQRWFDYSGTTLEEMQGWGWQKVHHPDHIERVVKHFRHCLKTGEPWEDTFPLLGKDGNYRWFLSRAIPIRDEQDNVVRWFGTNTDISDRKQTEDALQQSEERLRLALNASNQGLYDLNLQTGDAIVTPQYAQMLGYDPENFQETNAFWLERLHPDDLQRVGQVYLDYITGKLDQYQVEFRQRTQSGDWKWILSTGSIVAWDRDGNPLRMLGIHTDISDRKQAEEALRQSNAILNTINESTPTLIYVKDREGRIVVANPALLAIVGKSSEEILGKTSLEFHAPREEAEKIMENDRLVMQTGQSHQFEEAVDMVGGRRVFLSVKAPYRDEQGNIIGIIGISSDISDRKSAELELERLYEAEQQAREEAQTANRLKDEFLAVLSHELRSPLNPILGWAKLLQTRKLNPERTAEALTTIERNAKLQAQLIEDLLDISRIMQGKLTLNSATVSLSFVIYSALETVRLAAEAKNIQFNLALDATVSEVLGDAGRLQQVLWNLLSNAVKFTPPSGQVTIRLTQVDGDAQIQIIDTGKGINPEFLPYVFEYFRQEDGSTTRKFGGLGLGLAIARQIVEMHGGRIWADSQGAGFGATFTVKLPTINNTVNPAANVAIAASSPSAPKTPLAGMRILVVDDTVDTRELLTFLLEANGAIVLEVASAAEALQAFGEFQPDIILSDIGMPEMDGYELMRSLRKLETGKSIPAIALTAYAAEIDREYAIAAGFQRHVAKPIEPDLVIAYIVELVMANG